MKHFLITLLVAALYMVPNQSSLATDAATSKAPLKVGLIIVGSANDAGYNYAHDQGRLYLQKNMAGKVETSVAENIPESAEVERVMEKMVSQGTTFILSTSYGYLDPAIRVASRHPNIVIMQCGRENKTGVKNLGDYNCIAYESQYVAGTIAGRLTKTNDLGFIGAHPVPPVIQDVNAFTLGARSVNPKVKVHVVWTNSWSDPASESEAAQGLIEQHVDVLAMHIDSPIVVAQVAEKNGIYCVGFHADLRKYAPKGFLTGQAWNWGPLYVKVAQSIIDKSWKSADTTYHMKDGYSTLAPFGKAVPVSMQEDALKLKKKIEDGTYVVFQGPLTDRDGKERLPAGAKPDPAFLNRMDFFVPGVVGVLPKK